MRDRPDAWACRSGAALIVVLLLLLALTALGHGVFVLALQEASASRASRAVVQARLMAEGAVRRALRAGAGDTIPQTDGRPVLLAEGSASGTRFRVELRRVAPELYFVQGTGAAAINPGGPERVVHEVGRVVWVLSPLERLRAQTAAVEFGAGLDDPSAQVQSSAAGEAGPFDSPIGCRDRSAVIDSALAGRFFPPARSVSLIPGRIPALGFLEQDSLLARVQERVSGTVTPGPVVELGQCVQSALNWGTPSEAGSICAARRVALASEGTLTLSGGEGQGLLLVRGDLHLVGSARFHGLVLVAGNLTLDEQAHLEGIARVAGRVRVQGGSLFVGRLCPALLALEAAIQLRRPSQLPGSGWIRVF
jgi:hypothetical protein